MLRTVLISVFAFFLVFTFLAHDAHAGHDHPHALFGDGPSSPLHGETRKILALIVLLSFFALIWSAAASAGLLAVFAPKVYSVASQPVSSQNYLAVLLRRGILHSKAW